MSSRKTHVLSNAAKRVKGAISREDYTLRKRISLDNLLQFPAYLTVTI